MQRSSTWVRASAAALGLAGAAAVVAAAASAPLTGGTPVDARSAQSPTAALSMLLAGTGIVMVGALVWLLRPARRRKDDPPEHESRRIELPWIWTLMAIVLPLALGSVVIAAALTGARSIRTRPGFGVVPLGGAPSGGAPFSVPRSNGTKGVFAVPAWLPWTLLTIVGVAIVAVVALLWMRRARSPTEPPEASAADAALEAAIDALDAETDPRRAVIAAYRAMQRSLGEHGVVRAPAEAPREYLERALISTSSSEREARTLTGLFEEARYSTHPIPERVREVALTALRSLQRRLRTEAAQ